MKVADLHPGILPRGPLWNEGWIDILGRMLQVPHRERGKGGLFDAIRVAEIDELALLRRINRDAGAVTARDRLTYGGARLTTRRYVHSLAFC
jgi:hypothetical protein